MHQHRQIHVWITESDYLMLREQSAETRESVSAIVRRLIKTGRQRLRGAPPTQVDQTNGCAEDPLEELRRQYVS